MMKELPNFDPIFLAVGRALSIWSNVEHALCMVYTLVVADAKSLYAERSYWSIASFEGRIKMTGAVIEARFDGKPTIVATWVHLAKALTKANTVRNKIAHGTAVSPLAVGTAANASRPGKHDVYLVPYHHARHMPQLLAALKRARAKKGPHARVGPWQPLERFTLDELGKHTDVFGDVEQQVLGFLFRHFGERDSPRTSETSSRKDAVTRASAPATRKSTKLCPRAIMAGGIREPTRGLLSRTRTAQLGDRGRLVDARLDIANGHA